MQYYGNRLSKNISRREPEGVTTPTKSQISSAGDLTSHTATADGYVVVNKLKSINGTITLELPQNSLGDWFLRRWANWQKNSQDSLSDGFAFVGFRAGGHTENED